MREDLEWYLDSIDLPPTVEDSRSRNKREFILNQGR